MPLPITPVTGNIPISSGGWRYDPVTLVTAVWKEVTQDWTYLLGLHNASGSGFIYRIQTADPTVGTTTGIPLRDGDSRIFQGLIPEGSIWVRQDSGGNLRLDVEKV